jgi:hypothetical protein
MKSPREFWILYDGRYPRIVEWSIPQIKVGEECGDGHNESFIITEIVHVTEHSAYQELKDMCAELAEALEYYADENTMASLTGLPYGRRARAALIKYKAKIGAG